MSKKIDDSELQTLTLSPTNTNDDECSPFINLGSDETAFPISPPPSCSTIPYPHQTTSSTVKKDEKKKPDRLINIPVNNVKVAPSMRVSTPPGTTKVTYTNEKQDKGERKIDLSKIRERPTPGNTLNQKKDIPQLELGTRDSSRSPQAKGARNKVGSDEPGYLRPIPSYLSTGKDGSILSAPSRMNHSTSSAGSLYPTPAARTNPRAWVGRAGVRAGPRHRLGIEPRAMERPTQHHTFLADAADVRQIEQGLLQLMEDFQAGNLRAFGKDSRLRQMEAIREQQERLAKLHFEVGAEQDLYPPLSEEGLRTSHDNMRTLMEKLAQLSESIERLHTNTSSSDRKTSSTERKANAHQSQTPRDTPGFTNATSTPIPPENHFTPPVPSRGTPIHPPVGVTAAHQSSPANPRAAAKQRSQSTPGHHITLGSNGVLIES